jgi:twinkle protein
MATMISNGTVDLERYLKDGPPITKVRPASEFRERLKARFRNEEERQWGGLGFKKTLDQVRLRPGELSIWAGRNGDGKSALLGQIILGLIERGERACIASLEMPGEDTLKRMAQQGSAKAAPSELWQDGFMNWTDARLWLYDHVGTVRWKYMVALARYLADHHKITHFVIDSFTKCGIAPDDLTTQKQFADELASHCMGSGMHTHLVCHMRKPDGHGRRPNGSDVRGAGEITDLAHNVFLVKRNRDKELEENALKMQRDPDTFLIVEKQRNHTFEGQIGLWYHKTVYRWVETGLDPCDPMALSIRMPEQQEVEF